MDVLKLQYLMAAKTISRQDLGEVMGWSPGTIFRRVACGENWKVDEVNVLLRIGFSEKEIRDVFEEKRKEK